MNRYKNAILPACLILVCAASFTACKSKPVAVEQDDSPVTEPSAQQTEDAPDSQPAGAPDSQPAEVNEAPVEVPRAWIEERARKSEARLMKSEGGKLIARAIEAHGGLAQWFAQGPLAFRFAYVPEDSSKPARDTHQIIDTWSARAYHEMTSDRTQIFGWDGTRAWSTLPDDKVISPRFWSLTPYYFVGVPFVFADEGVNLEVMGETSLEERTYDLVKVTFGEGVGDAPDDYYITYIDRESGRVGALRYIVSYPGFFPDGGHSPEKLMIYDGEQRVKGMLFPESFRTFSWDQEKQSPIELVTKTTLTDVAFVPDTPASKFEAPEGARIIDGM